MTVKIPLTQGKVAIVDDCDKHLLKYRWYYAHKRSGGYVKRTFQYYKNEQRLMFLHHAIIGYPLNGYVVDHIDGNPFNNRRENLRIVTQRENSQNNKWRRNGKTSSKYVGVCWYKKRKMWQVTIRINGKQKWLGYFLNEKDASRYYLRAVKTLGEKE